MRVVRGATASPSIALDDGPPINFCRPAVDPLFSSAAEVWGDGSLALILTGMGTDGARGAADIVAAGGSVIAQDEETQRGVGHAAARLRTPVCVRQSCRFEQIAAEIVVVCGRPRVTPLDYDYLRKCSRSGPASCCPPTSNIWWRAACCRSPARPVWPIWASSCRAQRRGARKPDDEVVEAMTTNETFFFRDKIPFENFRTAIMPALLAARRAHRRIRIWCAAASTGQEPYSLAMMLKEMGDTGRRLAHRDRRHRSVQRRAAEGPGRDLQPVRGSARAADPAADQVFHAGRRHVADRARDARHGEIPAAQSAADFSRLARSIWCTAATC